MPKKGTGSWFTWLRKIIVIQNDWLEITPTCKSNFADVSLPFTTSTFLLFPMTACLPGKLQEKKQTTTTRTKKNSDRDNPIPIVPFSKGSRMRISSSDSLFRNVCACSVTKSCLTLCNPVDWIHQAPLSVGFPRQEYWSGLPFPPPRDIPDPGIKPASPAFQEGSFLTSNMLLIYVIFVTLSDMLKTLNNNFTHF